MFAGQLSSIADLRGMKEHCKLKCNHFVFFLLLLHTSASTGGEFWVIRLSPPSSNLSLAGPKWSISNYLRMLFRKKINKKWQKCGIRIISLLVQCGCSYSLLAPHWLLSPSSGGGALRFIPSFVVATLKCTQQHTISILFRLSLLAGSTGVMSLTIIINQNYGS